jgi:hypothetical protein
MRVAAAFAMTTEILVEYPWAVLTTEGARYVARACGGPREDGLWEGWIEFERDDGREVLRTERETTQPNRTDLAYWASGLTAIYLDGALTRARDRSAGRPPEVGAHLPVR